MTLNVMLHGTPLVVQYNYSPEQKQTPIDPGFDEYFEVIGVHTANGDDILGLFECNSSLQESLDDALAKAHHDWYADEY